ncbi:hypothetical protein D3C81_1234300 [compost metagenome]
MRVEVELVLTALALGLPVVILAQVEAERAAAAQLLVDRCFQAAAAAAWPVLVVVPLRHGFVKVAKALGGVAITGKAQVCTGRKRLAITGGVTVAADLAKCCAQVAAGMGDIERQCAGRAKVLA